MVISANADGLMVIANDSVNLHKSSKSDHERVREANIAQIGKDSDVAKTGTR